MKFTRKIGLAIFAILFVAVCCGFADDAEKFFDACKQGDEATVTKMLKKKTYLANERDGRGATALMIAVNANKKRVVELLVDKGARIDATDREGKTPLIIASMHGHKEIASFLIDKGANVDVRAKLEPNRVEVALGLVARDKYEEYNALELAVKYGHSDIVKLLLADGANEKYISNALKIARDAKKKDIEELLLSSLSPKERSELLEREIESKKRYRAEDFCYGITDDGKGIRITGLKDGEEGVMVTIPASIEGFPVTEVLLGYDSLGRTESWPIILVGFECSSNIRAIRFYGIVDCELSLKNCREICFSACTFKNTTLTIQKEWSGIPLDFSGTNIEKVVMQEGVVKLNGEGFVFSWTNRHYCDNLKSVIFSSTLKFINKSFFTECHNLQEIIIPKSVTKIDFADYVFSNCGKLPIATQARLRQLGYEGGF